MTLSSRPAVASDLGSAKAQANVLYKQINRINGRVDALGQKYDEVKIKLTDVENQIKNTKATVATGAREIPLHSMEVVFHVGEDPRLNRSQFPILAPFRDAPACLRRTVAIC